VGGKEKEKMFASMPCAPWRKAQHSTGLQLKKTASWKLSASTLPLPPSSTAGTGWQLYACHLILSRIIS